MIYTTERIELGLISRFLSDDSLKVVHEWNDRLASEVTEAIEYLLDEYYELDAMNADKQNRIDHLESEVDILEINMDDSARQIESLEGQIKRLEKMLENIVLEGEMTDGITERY